MLDAKSLFNAHLKYVVPKLEDEEFDEVYEHFKIVKRKKGDFLAQVGGPMLFDYWVVEGCIKAYFINRKGNEYIVQFAIEDWWVSDYNAFFNKIPSTYFIECLEDCTLLAITLEDREKVCKNHHKMEYFWRYKLTNGYIAVQKRILTLLKDSAEVRYKKFIENYSKLLQRLPRKYIASYLGMSRETLSRLHRPSRSRGEEE